MRNRKCEMRKKNARLIFEIKCEMRDRNREMRDRKCEMRDRKCDM